MNIIVTGGSGGIGKQVALYIARDKSNNVLITGRNHKSLAEVADSAEKKNIKYLVSDLNKFHLSSEQFKNDVISIFDTVDILINNAGSLYSNSFAETSEEQIREMMEVNFFAPVLIIRALLPLMVKRSTYCKYFKYGWIPGKCKVSWAFVL